MLAIAGCVVVVGLVAANLWLLRDLRRLRHRTRRLAILARNQARRVRTMDGATGAAFAEVQSLLREGRGEPGVEWTWAKPNTLN